PAVRRRESLARVRRQWSLRGGIPSAMGPAAGAGSGACEPLQTVCQHACAEPGGCRAGTEAAGTSAREIARLHGARSHHDDGELAADAKREDRPASAAGATATENGAVSWAAHAAGRDAV